MLSRTCRVILGMLALLPMTGAVASGLEYWVSPGGDDTHPGTKEKPFATLGRARDAVRKAKEGGLPKGGATVWLRGGLYIMSETFELTAQDSGTADAPVVYRAVPGEEVRLVGGRQIPLEAFKITGDPDVLSRLDPAARGKVLQVDLKAVGVKDFGTFTRRGGIERETLPAALELFFNDRPVPLARWPNEGWTRIASVPAEGQKGERFTYEGDRPRRWAKADDIWVHGYFNRNWCDTYERVARIDTATRLVLTKPPHDYRGYKAGQRIRFLNLLEELDEPGEWHVDRKTGTLYFWSPGPLDGARVFVSVLETPLVAMRDAEHITLSGCILECTRGCGVEIVGGRRNRVLGCTLRNIGTAGVAIGGIVPDLERRIYNDTTFYGGAGSDHGVVSCDIYDTGEYGIIVRGGNRRTLTPGGNYALNNHIYRFGRWVHTCRPAVFIHGVGNRVAHNLIHDAPHTAILFWGNDNVIEFNEIFRVCTDTGDAGALYIGRDWSQRGNIIRHNYFHDITEALRGESGYNAVKAVYLDDQASGTTVFGNVFYRVSRGIAVGGGRDNVIANNIFAFCGRTIQLDARGVGDRYSKGNILFDRLMVVNHDQPPYSERYPALARILADDPGLPKGNVIQRNICVGGSWDVFALSPGQEFVRSVVKVEDNLTEGDPGLVAPDKGDFRLREGSPALKLGFVPIPLHKIGLYPDECRRLSDPDAGSRRYAPRSEEPIRDPAR